MSHDNVYWGGRGNCPQCGRWCGDIRGQGNEYHGLTKVTGECKVHGTVDLTSQGWGWDDFNWPDET